MDKSHPAFPILGLDARWYGITKRELFAAMAMQGLVDPIAHPVMHQDTARVAVSYADALLAELAK